jgi:hypothetical protein
MVVVHILHECAYGRVMAQVLRLYDNELTGAVVQIVLCISPWIHQGIGPHIYAHMTVS